MQKPLYIDQQKSLNELCSYFAQQEQQGNLSALFLDTEFIRQTTYYPKLALIQVTDGEKLALIDPLSIADLSPFFELCFNPNIIKVFHSGSQDLEIFYHLCGQLPKPVFDTQIAAAMLGSGMQVGYAPLVKELLDIDLDKSQTRTNWLHRPLSDAQLKYAGNDVIYLEKIYHHQQHDLVKLNRLHWLDIEFNYLSECKTYEVDIQKLWKKVKGHQRLKPQQLMVLQLLAELREKFAIKKDKVRKHVIADDILIKLAQKQPKTSTDLSQTCELSKQFISRWGEQVLSCIKHALSRQKDEYPQLLKRMILTKQQETTSKELMAICEQKALTHNISLNFLAQRKELDKITLNHSSPIANFSSRLFTGWRDKFIGKEIQQYLENQTVEKP